MFVVSTQLELRTATPTPMTQYANQRTVRVHDYVQVSFRFLRNLRFYKKYEIYGVFVVYVHFQRQENFHCQMFVKHSR